MRSSATTIGIIGAMQVEVELLLAQLEGTQVTQVGDMAFHAGELRGVPVVVVRCGVGKVSAASCAQALIDRFAPVAVINTGIAGALDAGLDIGDLVVSTDLVQYDVDVTALGYESGIVPELEDGLLGCGRLSFPADEALADLFCRAAAEAAPDVACVRGRIASGDRFVSTREDNERIAARFGASCCEMEGAAIAQVCWRNGVPFVASRAISDKADESSMSEYRDNERRIAEHCAAITAHAVELLVGRDARDAAVPIGQAALGELDQLVELRLAYLAADFGELSAEEVAGLRAELPGYLAKHLGRDLLAFVARETDGDAARDGETDGDAARDGAADGDAARDGETDGDAARDDARIVSCAWLLLVPKPPSPRFPHGRTGVLFNVYTAPDFRRRGLARQVMAALIDEARLRRLDVLELHATADGYPLYQLLGFADDSSTHRPMRLML